MARSRRRCHSRWIVPAIREASIDGKRFFHGDETADVNRRRFLSTGSAAFVAATAGCTAIGVGERKPVVLRATPASGDETDVRCRLDGSFVTDHPPLEDVLVRASENEPIEWEEVGITEATARDLVDALQRHCRENGGEYRGLYQYGDRWFFISVASRSDGTVGLEHTDDGHEH